MNANELADSIATCEPNLGRIATDCADMIRQQQTEIEALKLSLSGHSAEILSKNRGIFPIGEFSKELKILLGMNNEPVAWMGIRRHGETRVSVEKLDKDDIPLYIHPVKELTDEEIINVSGGENLSEQVFFWNRNAVLNFARAILRKAQEK